MLFTCHFEILPKILFGTCFEVLQKVLESIWSKDFVTQKLGTKQLTQMIDYYFNLSSGSPTKWSNTFKKFVSNSRRIV